MVGCLGNDHFGETLHAALQQEQIQTDALVKALLLLQALLIYLFTITIIELLSYRELIMT